MRDVIYGQNLDLQFTLFAYSLFCSLPLTNTKNHLQVEIVYRIGSCFLELHYSMYKVTFFTARYGLGVVVVVVRGKKIVIRKPWIIFYHSFGKIEEMILFQSNNIFYIKESLKSKTL